MNLHIASFQWDMNPCVLEMIEIGRMKLGGKPLESGHFEELTMLAWNDRVTYIAPYVNAAKRSALGFKFLEVKYWSSCAILFNSKATFSSGSPEISSWSSDRTS